MRGRRHGSSAGFALLLAAAIVAPQAAAQAPAEKVVTSFDGTPIVTAFFSASGLAPGATAPTILLGHGWAGSRATDPGSGRVGMLRRAGYNVLTWDARGFGQSGGTASADSPELEGRDAQALIDYVATLSQAQLDSPGDPRVGMSGGSYGGGIQWVTAGLDRRVDAIAPEIAWHSLLTALFKEGSVKGGWGTLLFGAGLATSTAPGISGPAGTQLGSLDPHLVSAFASGSATGSISEEDRRWFESRGPGRLVNDIRVPTLIVQGTIDTLFTLEEAVTNYKILRANDVPVKMMWYCGGHGSCFTSSGPGDYVERAIVGWFDRHLKGDESVVTGPRFEWLAEDGVWRAAADYPLRDAAAALTGSGSGPLPVTPLDYALSGNLVYGTVSPLSIEARVPATAGADVVGTPQLELTYSGVAVPAQTHLYAQVVDPARRLVVGNQVTPLPVTLDGRERTITRSLEGLSSRSTASGYVVQVVGGSNVYGPQRSVGGITSSRLAVSLPAVDAAGTPDDVSGPGLPAAPTPPAPAGRRRVRIALAGPGGRAARLNRVLRVRVGTSDRLSGLTLVLRDERGRRMGRGTRATLTGRRVVRVLLSRRLRAGAYRLVATANARDGTPVTAARTLRFR